MTTFLVKANIEIVNANDNLEKERYSYTKITQELETIPGIFEEDTIITKARPPSTHTIGEMLEVIELFEVSIATIERIKLRK